MKVETQAEAKVLNETGVYGPYRAANWHLMIAPLRFPRTPGTPEAPGGWEREYRVGDDIRYDSSAAYCASDCRHDAPPEDW